MEKDGVRLRLGDVIEIIAPTNLELNSQSFLIEYIDETKMKLGNIANISKEGTVGSLPLNATRSYAPSAQNPPLLYHK